MAKRSLITGITGQDGAYLSQFLLEKGYDVHGAARRSSHLGFADHRPRWLGIHNDVQMHDADLSDFASLIRLVQKIQPDEIYNLAAQPFVATSWREAIVIACSRISCPAPADLWWSGEPSIAAPGRTPAS